MGATMTVAGRACAAGHVTVSLCRVGGRGREGPRLRDSRHEGAVCPVCLSRLSVGLTDRQTPRVGSRQSRQLACRLSPACRRWSLDRLAGRGSPVACRRRVAAQLLAGRSVKLQPLTPSGMGAKHCAPPHRASRRNCAVCRHAVARRGDPRATLGRPSGAGGAQSRGSFAVQWRLGAAASETRGRRSQPSNWSNRLGWPRLSQMTRMAPPVSEGRMWQSRTSAAALNSSCCE